MPLDTPVTSPVSALTVAILSAEDDQEAATVSSPTIAVKVVVWPFRSSAVAGLTINVFTVITPVAVTPS